MSLTRRSHRSARDPSAFPTTQLALLALVRVAEPIALTSIFPYAWKLVLTFNFGDKSDASFYAGILISAFSLAESLTGMFWGGLSDRYGRKPILLLGCLGTIMSLLVVGFSSNFWMALAGRALGGLLNGNIGVVQTMVGELITLPEHEPKAFAVMPFVWSIGTIIGPALGGTFADPATTFPSVFASDGLFGRFPYLLPNLICAGLLLVAIVAGVLAIEETHPDMQPWSTQQDLDQTTAETPLMGTQGSTGHVPVNLSDESYGTFNQVDLQPEEQWRVKPNGKTSSISSGSRRKVLTRRVVMTIVALGIFTYHSMTYDHLLPIFLQDDRGNGVSVSSGDASLAGGLGLSTQAVGVIMSVNGVIALFVQGVIFPIMASWLGIWRLFILVTFGHPISYFIVPFLAFLPAGALYPGIYAALSIRNFFSILGYPVLLILLKEASPGPTYLGKINGLSASVGAAARTIASPVAGYLYAVGMAIDFTPLAWWTSAAVAVIGACQIFFMRRQKDTAQVHSLARHVSRESLRPFERPQVVHIKVETIDEESEGSENGCRRDHEFSDDDASERRSLLPREQV